MTNLLSSLQSNLTQFFPLSKSRVETLSVLIMGLIPGRAMNLSHLVCQFSGPAKTASNYRRLQRFFQYVCLNDQAVARLIVKILHLERKKRLALDRTKGRFPVSSLTQTLNFAAREIKSGEDLIIVTNMVDAKRALTAYKKRWASNACSQMPNAEGSILKIHISRSTGNSQP